MATHVFSIVSGPEPIDNRCFQWNVIQSNCVELLLQSNIRGHCCAFAIESASHMRMIGEPCFEQFLASSVYISWSMKVFWSDISSQVTLWFEHWKWPTVSRRWLAVFWWLFFDNIFDLFIGWGNWGTSLCRGPELRGQRSTFRNSNVTLPKAIPSPLSADVKSWNGDIWLDLSLWPSTNGPVEHAANPISLELRIPYWPGISEIAITPSEG
jgi:hypothetical protein